MNKTIKNILVVLMIIVLSSLALQLVKENKSKVKTIPYSKFLNIVEKKQKMRLNTDEKKPLTIESPYITGYYYDKATSQEVKFKTFIAHHDRNLLDFLRKNKVRYFKGKPREENMFWQVILNFLPLLLLLGIIWFFMYRQIQSSGSKAMSFGKSKAKMNVDMKNKTNFSDVAGVEEAKEELSEIVDFLKSPTKYQGLGAKIPKGVLLIGPPGTGKTLLAKAVAGEAGVPFFSISGSDFVEMFVGVGASRVRDLFGQAKKNSPCIIFIDEIDAVGRRRGAGMGGGHDEREQTLNQLLVEMDGFEDSEGVILIAATNRADVLDPALLRPGRFDRQVMVDAPDLKGRVEILKIHSKKVPVAADVSWEVVGRGTPGFTGADLANLINEGAILAARGNKKKVSQHHLEEARDKVLMGPERKSFYIAPEEKEMTAYHEAGHALLGTLLTHTEPIHKVTIIPRGRALGLTQSLPEKERHSVSKNYLIDEITMLMGGLLAEEIKYSDVTTGGSNDIERASGLARKMVTEWGMSDVLGPIRYSRGDSETIFIGRQLQQGSNYSDEYAKIIDQEVKKIINSCHKHGMQLLKKYNKALEKITSGLVDKETLTGDEVRAIVFGKKPPAKKTTTPKGKVKKPRVTKIKKTNLPDLGGAQPA